MAATMDQTGTLDTGENIGSGNILEEFKEIEEVKALIDGLKDVYNDQIAMETSYERFLFIIDSYQEQPHLIDPHLESLLEQLLNIGRNDRNPPDLQNLAFKYLYLITKMRGFKVIVRLFPHEVVDVEPVLALLAKQDPNNHEAWETRYILLLWLSMACMIPFDLTRLDSNIKLETGETKRPVMDVILDVGKAYMTVPDKSRDASAYLMARFMTRPDVKKEKLPEFLDWALKSVKKAEMQTMTGSLAVLGILYTLASLFKTGKREDLLEHAPAVLQEVADLHLEETNNTVLRKVAVKVIQRLGLTFLKHRIASWRYQRGSRSLADNLLDKSSTKEENKMQGENKTTEEEEEYDIPEEIEEVIEHLLGGLRDKDTIVRWSAAKGIGRITGRLPKELADEVVESLMGLFTLQETDGAWHGGCLALAELGRRGLLLPQRLPKVVPVVLKALAYDERRGNFSVGAHVRDAACYVCWAFARAYEPQEIQPYVNEIASALVIASIFDREVNVRRAAAAAFQENVGRQGTFPHGIDILTTADYHAVGNRTHCYLDLSVFASQFSEYTKPLIEHLVQVKVGHWDSAIREVTAKALHNLTVKAPDYMAKTALPTLLPMATSMDLYLRHGAILSIAEILHALSKRGLGQGRRMADIVDSAVIRGVKNIAKHLSDNKLYRGLGGELMRKAVSTLIEKASLSKMPYHEDPIIDVWQEILDDCLHHIEPDIQVAAVSAIPAFFTEYYMEASGLAKPLRQEQVIEKYLRELKSAVEVSRQGHSLALGSLPKFMISGKLRGILAGLIYATKITEKEEKWAEARRDAIKAITGVVSTVGVERTGEPSCVLCQSNTGEVFEALLVAMRDYTLDSRGDVGAWVREASMSGLHDLTSLIVKTDPELLSPQLCEHTFKSLIQQACEKIDRTRSYAGSLFGKLLYHKPPIPYIPHREEIQNIFPQEDIERINWAAPADTFPRFTRLLDCPTYTYCVLLGLTVSVGGLTESLVKHSSTSLHSYLRSISKNEKKLSKFGDTLLQIFKDHLKVDRVSLPLLKMLDQLLSKGCFEMFTANDNHEFPTKVLELVKKEINRSGDPWKLMASADVFCGLLQYPGEVRKKCMTNLSIFLCHKYPRVRKTTANKLYEALVTYDDVCPVENLEEIMLILSETNWDNELNEIRPIRNNLCDLLDVPKPVMKTPGAAKA